jgi:hypothetical protein
LAIIPFWGDIQIAPGAADESFEFIRSKSTALYLAVKVKSDPVFGLQKLLGHSDVRVTMISWTQHRREPVWKVSEPDGEPHKQ